jgi:glycosyltransferase involved in cell wall biosynthesis
MESVFSQHFGDFEFILIDDASSDATPDLLESYRNDPRLRLIRNARNLGLTKSLNIGLEAARGKYICRLDAGDVSLPGRFDKQIQFMESHHNIYLSGSGARNVNARGEALTVFRPVTDPAKLRTALGEKCSIYHSTIIFRNTDEFKYREKFIYAQDYDLYLRCLSRKKVLANLPDILIQYRVAGDSISYSKRAHQMLFAEKAREFYFQRETGEKDSYDSFDPAEILDIDTSSVKDTRVIAYEIEAAFKVNDRKEVRSLYGSYIKEKRNIDRMALFFLASFLPVSCINRIRKAIWG